MKIKHTLLILFPAVTLLLASCVENIDMEDFRPNPRLVLNTVALVNSPLTASLSRTWFYTDKHPNVTIGNAHVELYVNDTFRELLVWQEGDADYNSKGYYASSYCPAVADRIRLVAKAEGFKEVSAETILPQPARLVSTTITTKRDTIYSHSYYEVTTTYTNHITMKDDGTQKDYYLIRFESGSSILGDDNTWRYYWNSIQVDYSSDPLFDQDLSTLDKVLGNDWLSGYNGRVFSDELINGKEYTFNFKSQSSFSKPIPDEELPDTDYPEEMPDTIPPPRPPELFRVVLYSLSEDYYKYLKVLQTKDDGTISYDLIDAGLAEPIRVYSNVSGGLGICGGSYKDSLTIEMPEPE